MPDGGKCLDAGPNHTTSQFVQSTRFVIIVFAYTSSPNDGLNRRTTLNSRFCWCTGQGSVFTAWSCNCGRATSCSGTGSRHSANPGAQVLNLLPADSQGDLQTMVLPHTAGIERQIRNTDQLSEAVSVSQIDLDEVEADFDANQPKVRYGNGRVS